jgi:hypothetical protein
MGGVQEMEMGASGLVRSYCGGDLRGGAIVGWYYLARCRLLIWD